jgi:hypothetical protein
MHSWPLTKGIILFPDTKSTVNLDDSSAPHSGLVLFLRGSQYEEPTQEKSEVVSDYRAVSFWTAVFWTPVPNLHKLIP